jgi:hypothetical protein
VRWEGAPATVATLLLVAALVVPAAAVSKKNDAPASSGDPTTDALTFLRTAQNDDGGFGDDRGDKSNQLFSGWAALAFAAAGYNPASTTSGGDTLIDYIEDGVKKLDDAPSLARTILVVDASGLDAEKFGGENLVRALERERDGDGSYDNQVAVTAFALLAQKAAGANGGAKGSAGWILEQQNEDGGWAIRSGSRSDVDVTASVLQALDATGELSKRPKTDALAWLEEAQNSDGGFGQFDGSSSNSQSTAFAIQGLEAAGEDPADFGRGDPIDYLEDQQLKDGSVKYGGGSSRTPVWVTSQAILGFERAALPLSELSEPARFGNGKTPDQNDLIDKGDDPPKPPDVPSSPGPRPGPNITPPDPDDFPKPDRPKRPGTGPKPSATSPGQADLVPPGFSFGSIVPEPEPPSSLTQAGDAAGTAAALAAAPGEAPAVESGQAGNAAATTGASGSVLDEAAAAARSAAAAAGSAGA